MSTDGSLMGTAMFDGRTDTNLTVTMQSLRDKGINTDSVDGTFFVIRENNDGNQLGAFVANTTTGTLSFRPTENTRTLWAMVATNGANYSAAWLGTGFRRGSFSAGLREAKRRYSATRLTASTNGLIVNNVADFGVLRTGVESLLDSISIGNIRPIDITWTDAPPADLLIGFGDDGSNATGLHLGNIATANPNRTTEVQSSVIGGELIEVLFNMDNAFGFATTNWLYGGGNGNGTFRPLILQATSRDILRMASLMSRP
jgi:hypothetical protein